MSFSAYLFDLDGTLVDTAPDIAASLNTALGSLASEPVSASEVRTWVGKGAGFLIEQALQRFDVDAMNLEPTLGRFAIHYAQHPWVESTLYDGVVAALDALKSRGHALGMVTNKLGRVSRPLLDAAGLSSYFDVVICGDEVSHAKPAPDLLLAACAAIAVEPARTLMVGDSSNDVTAARAAGCPIVCVNYGYNHGQEIADVGADRVIDSLLELL